MIHCSVSRWNWFFLRFAFVGLVSVSLTLGVSSASTAETTFCAVVDGYSLICVDTNVVEWIEGRGSQIECLAGSSVTACASVNDRPEIQVNRKCVPMTLFVTKYSYDECRRGGGGQQECAFISAVTGGLVYEMCASGIP